MKRLIVVFGAYLVVACTCSKKPEQAASEGVASAETTVAPSATADNTAAPTPAAAGAAAPNEGNAGPAGGGKTIAENSYGKVQANDAGSVTAKRGSDSVTTGPGGVTKANGVVVDPKTGTVTVPGKGTFKTP